MDELSEEDKLTVRSLMGHLPENIQLTHPRSSVLVRFSVSCHNPSRLPRSSRVMKASLFLSRTPSALSRISFLVPMIPFLNLPSTWYAYPGFFYLVHSRSHPLSFQSGTIDDVKAKAEQLAKEMGN